MLSGKTHSRLRSYVVGADVGGDVQVMLEKVSTVPSSFLVCARGATIDAMVYGVTIDPTVCDATTEVHGVTFPSLINSLFFHIHSYMRFPSPLCCRQPR